MPRKTATTTRRTARGTARPAARPASTPEGLDTARFAALLDERTAHAREQIDAALAEIREVTIAAQDTPADDEHDPEGSTVTIERANEMSMLAAAEASLTELTEARRRLDHGSYGICERCGSEILTARLEIRPEARTCVACAGTRRR